MKAHKRTVASGRTAKRGQPRKMTEICSMGCFGSPVAERSGGNCRRLMDQGSLCRPDLPNSGGALEAIFLTLSADMGMKNVSLGSTCIKVHESVNMERNSRLGNLADPRWVEYNCMQLKMD